MSLFSLENILPAKKTTTLKNVSMFNESASNTPNVIDIDDIGYVDHSFDSFSFVQEGYNFALEANAYFNQAEKEFYTKILGSYGDDNIINESFSDFFASIKKIIKKFIDWIKKIFKQFAAKLAGLVGSEKYIKKHKNLVNQFSSEDEFEYQGYKFTNIDAHDIPKATACDVFMSTAPASGSLYSPLNNKGNIFGLTITGTDSIDRSALAYTQVGYKDDSYNNGDSLSNEEKTANNDLTKGLNDALEARNKELDDVLEDYYDYFRAEVIGSDSRIDDGDFAEELFKLFRDGETSSSSITIDSNFVSEAYRRFDKYKDTIKNIEKNRDAMIKDYEDLEKQLDKLIEYKKDASTFEKKSVTRTYSTDQISRLGDAGAGVHYDQAAFDKMNIWLKKQSTRVNRMCDIHSRAFSAKLEAAKDCFSQDKKILNKAIQQVLKRSGKK
jgi:hypothetical protein